MDGEIQQQKQIKLGQLVQLKTIIDYDLGGDMVWNASGLVSSIITKRIERCFGSFLSWSDPIVQQEEMDQIYVVLCEHLSPVVKLVHNILGYNLKKKNINYEHLAYCYANMSLFLVMTLC